ncbi:hypothetical protein GYMLUDRAFT_707183 [Collybiopsis luxurians FD-317 M1]|uniref:Uncharacterized protein n=1 Tax=Collybiopsis luxurians FD-317 M1 TaxID=944289 RepID=A0A0D0C6I4_9AGAR|nr:hypothetical protein GYMLUDRAFT_707183 [Collybiopsis luxurians FD-317 M1]
MSDDDLLKVLEAIPALTSFAFDEAGDGEKPLTARFFRSLEDRDGLGLGKGEDGSSNALTPKLTHLATRMSSDSPPWNELYSFLEFRLDSMWLWSHAMSHLQQARIYVTKLKWEQISDELKGKFAELPRKGRGLDLKFLLTRY